MTRIGSLCTGYGGLDSAVEEVIGGELAWVADNDPDKSAILARRFPGVPNLGDLEAVDWSAVEPVDMLTAGFPCTDISCAGRRAGLRKGNRSGVWYFVARAIAELRPPLVVIENVKELLSVRADSDMEPCPWCLGDTGPESAMRALGAVLADLAEIGFDAEWVSVPAASAGACHLRWRVFILAWPAADAGSSRGREVTRGAHGDESQDARWPAEHDHRLGCDRADVLADTAGPRPSWCQDAGADSGDAGARLRGGESQRGRSERPAADAAGVGEREPADEADPITGSRGPRAVPSSGSARAPAGGGAGSCRRQQRGTGSPDGRTSWTGTPGR